MTTQTVERPPRSGAPMGRDEVVAAVLATAAQLYADKGPTATSIREVAAQSGVNHGLVFRHFGSKERLIGATLEYLGRCVSTLIEQDAPVEQIEDALTVQTTVMARALLEGYPVSECQTVFPGVALLLERIRPLHDGERAARFAAANAVALQLGWRLFGPFLRTSAGLEGLTDAAVRDAVLAASARIVDPEQRRSR
ncbi:MAG: helix-turn-helix domain-containing protein [Actinomycetota bacterium]|nr:helix-turn-helix domain-containing protein [Actinomycetota bacterium]